MIVEGGSKASFQSHLSLILFLQGFDLMYLGLGILIVDDDGMDEDVKSLDTKGGDCRWNTG